MKSSPASHRQLAHRLIVLLFILSQLAAALPPAYASAPASSIPNSQFPIQNSPLTQSPLALSRVQTSYVAGQTVVEFTLTNNLPTTRLPDVAVSATITDTVNILAAFDLSEDVNTLRGITLADTLTPGTTLLAASGNPAQAGNTLTWTLPDLPPQASATLTMSLQTPAQGTGFVNLDTGAQVSAARWGEPVNATAPPAVLIPTGIDPAFTLPTVDANARDADMLWKSAALGQDALSMFEFVRGLGYDPYKGSLRGTRGTLWGEAGNSVDQSSLLIAMLRAAGIPARYRHGALDSADAQTLIASMFAAQGAVAQTGVAGTLPAGTPISDPVNDPALLALVSDHWWVEAYLPGSGWTNLDPSFANAQPGDVFATPGANDQIAELPDALRHKATVTLRVEQYNQFPIGGTFLNEFVPIEITYPMAQLAAKSLTVGHYLNTEVVGAVFTTVTHTYTPFFDLTGEDFQTLGDPFQDILSNFPFASHFTTAEWLTVTTTDPDGHSETFTRTLKDLVGLDVRLNGGGASITLPEDNSAFLKPTDVFVATFLPNVVRDQSLYARQRATTLVDGQILSQAGQVIDSQGNPPTPEEEAATQRALLQIQLGYARFLSKLAYDFAESADEDLAGIEESLFVKLYYALPRVIINASQHNEADATVIQTLDLRSTRAEAIVYPGQATSAALSAQWTKGVLESYREGQVLQDATGVLPLTTARVFDAMTEQGIKPMLVTPATMQLLDVYGLDSEATAHAVEALLEGKSIVIPSAPVEVDGEDVLGWWEVDPVTGETISVMENGLHLTAIEYGFLEMWDLFLTFYEPGKLAYEVGQLWDWIACNVVGAIQGGGSCGNPPTPPLPLPGPPSPLPSPWPPMPPLPGPSASPSQPDAIHGGLFDAAWRFLPAHLCPIENCGIEQFANYDLAPGTLPLPDMLFGHLNPFYASPLAIQAVSVTDNGGSGDPVLNLSTNTAEDRVLPYGAMSFDLALTANFDDEITVSVLAPADWHVIFDDENTVLVTPNPDTAPGLYTLDIVAQAQTQPDVFAVTQQEVEVVAVEALTLGVTSDERITVPVGISVAPTVSGQTNDAEAEIPDSAFNVGLYNATGSAKTLSLTVTGAPAGWLILNGARQASTTLTLPATERTAVGLYVSPPTLPAPGTSFSMEITVSDGGALSESETVNWTMPSQPFNYLNPLASTLYLGSDSSTDFTLEMTNVGNADGTFPIIASLPPITASVTGLPSPVSLAVGETQSFNATLNTSGIPLGSRFPIILGSPAPGSYTQYAVVEAQIVSSITEPIFIASDHAANACTLGEPGLSDALESLALAMVHLEASCLNGDCNLSLRDQTVSAAYSVALYAGVISPGLVQDDAVLTAADTLASHTDTADILADLQTLSDAVVGLDTEVCAWSESMPVLKWSPYYGAALVSEPTTYTLDLTNAGTLATTYALTVTLPSSVVSGQYSVNPGETSSFEFPVSSPSLGLFDLDAVAVVVGQDSILSNSNAVLNVVDKFVQLTAVTPDPPFVETGVSATDISISVANNANILQPATAHVEILHPTGGISYTAEVPVTILVGSPRNYALGTVDTSGWETGVYTITVELRNPSGALIPDGSGYGFLGVGQAVGISHAVEPGLVAPGAVTVTTVITTEILTPAIITDTMGAGNQEIGNGNQEVGNGNQNEPIPHSQFPIPNSISSTFPITRTEDTDPAITYAGTWTVVTVGGFHVRASHNDYTWADAAGETATMTFNGTWLHLGFVTGFTSGQAEILVDGVSQGVVDLYTQDPDVVSFVYDGFADTAHTLQIFVLGTHHPNSLGNRVQLDYVDTWDGTLYADGWVEQDSARVWHNNNWVTVTNANASGGTYMTDDGNNGGSAWFPFTGDSVTFVGLANWDGFRAGVYVDGVWKDNLWLYNTEAVTRTISFEGLGTGPHVMRITNYYGEPSVDAFVTPALEPGYVPPVETGIVRYEEDHPAFLYDGYPFETRKSSWDWETAIKPTSSEIGVARSSTLNDTITFTFEGRWVNLGFLSRSDGGTAEVFIDGVSQGTIGLYEASGDIPVEFQYGNLITGTHTLSITVLAQPDPPSVGSIVRFDYVDVWDGTPLPDDFVNVRKGTPVSRLHFNKSGEDIANNNAIDGDFFNAGLPNSWAGVWYHFTGTSFTLYGFTRNNTTNFDVFVDGEFLQNVSFHYPFSEQPFAVHFTGLEDGPHTVHVQNIWVMRLDGFASNQPDIPYQPVVEWWNNAPAGNGAPFFGTYGIAGGMAAGDVDGDGTVEIVVPADDNTYFGSLFLFRGDGGDTGDGDPIIWVKDLNEAVFRTWVSSPALADLDGQPGAEIIVAAGNQLFAFRGDGSTYWAVPTASIFETLSAPAVGNLDLDPEPEIVVNLGNTLEVRNHDGTLAWSTVYPAEVNPPVLADLTGDGLLDIVLTGWDDEVLVYDFNYGSPQLVWSVTLPTSMAGTFGAPAIADIDGLQPGGDPGPEVALASNGLLTVLNGEDGSLVWDTPLDPGNPGGVSIADLDGDGEVEIVTGMRYEFETGRFGMLYALNADGSLLWDAIAEDSSSANNASVLDLDGDGIYEVAWNGKEQGFTIFSGLNGSILFNEPLVNSFTGTDYPLIVDVDNDGQAEIVSAALGGVRVFGFGAAWGPARPLWNEHSYHITNINDDLTVPFSEPNSWESHNTYRTQTPFLNPMPSYAVALTHTVGLDDVTVLTNTFNIPPTTSNDPIYGWDYAVTWENTVVTQTFTSLLTNLQPGESRMVAQGTTADYVVSSGTNHLELPPLFVSVAHIVDVQPVTQTVGAGGSAVFDVVLTNPSGVSALYTLSVSGFPTGWATLSGAVPVPAGDSVTVPLTVDIPLDADTATLPFLVSVTTDQGAADQAGGALTVANLLELEIMPANQTVTTGEVATYTLSLTNADTVARTYTLSGSGLAPLTLPDEVTVSANSTAFVPFSAQAASEGANPFTLTATEENGTASGQATATVIGEGFQQVEVAILPATAPTGPGVLTPFDVRITNLGTVPDTYDLTASIPTGWEASLTLFGQPVETVTVAPGAGNALTLKLFLTPASDATPSDYPFTVTAQSQLLLLCSGDFNRSETQTTEVVTTCAALTSDTGAGVAQVGNLGVSVALSGPGQVSGSGVWDVTVTNNGAVADTYDLTAYGPFAQFAQLSPASVTLAPGASQTVQLTASGFDFLLATDYLLGVHAQSQTQSYVQDEDTLAVAISPAEGVVVAWQPASQTVSGSTVAVFTVVVSNTGNVQTIFTLTGSGSSGASVDLPLGSVIIPAHATATLLVVANAPGNGTYTLTVSADSGGAQGSDTATLVVEGVVPPVVEIYLPLVAKP
ncbi:MAG: hypothetical protein HUU38_00490 [Anaerolineales bacterium]|nr:hypothetical protein [Anaerolineales bacterium]